MPGHRASMPEGAFRAPPTHGRTARRSEDRSVLIPADPVHAFVDYPDVPVPNAADRSARRADLRGQGHLRRRRLRHRLRQPGMEGGCKAGDGARAGRCRTARRRRALRRQDPHGRAGILARRAERALRHADQPGRAGARAGRIIVRARPRRSRRASSTLPLGSDTGGSVRGPASFCGIIGLRPTYGRIDISRRHAARSSFDTVGWFSRDMDIFASVGAVLLGEDIEGPPLTRMVIADDAFALLDGRGGARSVSAGCASVRRNVLAIRWWQ